MLSSKNISTTQPIKKLGPKRLGPFEVIERVGQQANGLKLLTQYKSIHDVFHISLLEPYHRRPGTVPLVVHPELVEEILDHKVIKGKNHYLVKWEGFSPAENQWVKESDFTDNGMINQYHEEYPFELNRPPKRQRN